MQIFVPRFVHFIPEKVTKISSIFSANIHSKTTFVQMHLNNWKSIFEIYRVKNAPSIPKS